MTRTCRTCGVTAYGTSNIIRVFVKSSAFKYGVSSTCKRCNAAVPTSDRDLRNIKGPYCLLTDVKKPIKVCACCKDEIYNTTELVSSFRQHRHSNTKPSSFVAICKKCETVACMVLSEFTRIIRDGEEIEIDSPKYYTLLKNLYSALGYTDIPMEEGHPVDVLKFPLRYTLPDGRPFVKSAKRIWQIKIEAGYLVPKEDDFE